MRIEGLIFSAVVSLRNSTLLTKICQAMCFILGLFQLVVTAAFNYLIQFTVRKTCIEFEGLQISRKATFHCITIWVFNWDSKRLTTTSWESNNGWTSCHRRWVDFSVIRSWSEVYCSLYFPTWGTSVVTQINPAATWITFRKRENRNVVVNFFPVFLIFLLFTQPQI